MAKETRTFVTTSFNMKPEVKKEFDENLYQDRTTQTDWINKQIEKYNKSKRKKQAS